MAGKTSFKVEIFMKNGEIVNVKSLEGFKVSKKKDIKALGAKKADKYLSHFRNKKVITSGYSSPCWICIETIHGYAWIQKPC